VRCPSCGNPNREEARFCDSCGTRLQPHSTERAEEQAVAAVPSDAPELVASRYRVERFLGRGARKRVYAARDTEAGGREVAVAVFDTEGMQETVLARARREAQAMSKLGEHPHIVRVLDAGEDGGVPYIVSEYVAGGAVEALLEQCEGRQLELERALRIAADACRALEHAHARGIVHRDLKPANVWLDADGSARLGDFGLAATDRRSRAAVEGMLVGTVAYLPPEQVLGRASEPASDLYSLGAMLYELLTGEPPFPGTDAVAIIGQHLNDRPVPPSQHRPDIPPALDELVLALLAKAPAERPASARDVRRELERIATEPAAEREEDGGPPREDNPLEGLAGGVFVGRERELGEAREVLEDALAGEGRLLLLAGEPGIGKTRTAEQLATYARVRGARVHWGRCQEGGGAPPYWPWSEALRSLIEGADPVGLRWQLGGRAADIAQVVPELREVLGGDLEEPPAMDADQARFRLFDSVATFLARLGGERPLVLVLDDLHWADEPSLLLLRFVARRLSGTGLLLLGTYRDVELGRHHPLAGTLGELAGLEATRRLSLRGLDAPGVARYIELTAGTDASPALAEAVREQTDGNPFFVAEVVRLLASEGRLADGGPLADGLEIPQGVREVVGRRLDRLSDSTNETLRLAAVCGRRFRASVLERISDQRSERVSGALREASDARLVIPSRSDVDLHSFAHALVRETLLAEVPAARLAAIHGEIGSALEEVHAGSLDRHLSELAHHHLVAAPGGDTGRAIDYARRAAAQARERLAYEEAAGLLRRALEVLDLGSAPDPELRLELMVELGEAERRSGHYRDARSTLDQAASIARELGRRDDLARIAIDICALSEAGVIDEPVIELLEEALTSCGEGDSALRAELLSGLAQQLYWIDPAGRSTQLGLEAVEMARRVGDPRALAAALVRRQFTGGIGRAETERRLREGAELHDLAKRLGDRELELRAHIYRLRDRLELGDVSGLDAELAAVARLAGELRQPQHLWHVPLLRGMRALIDGCFEDAERLAAEALAGGERAQEPVSAMFHAIQDLLLRRLRLNDEDRARLVAMTAQLTELAKNYPTIPAWRCSLAATHAALGDEAEARAAFEPLAAAGFENLPFDIQWVISLTLLAEAAAFLGDVPRAEQLYELLLPYDGLTVVAGRAAACQGPVARLLGRLAQAAGRADDAERHLRESLALCERMGYRPFIAINRVELARLLLEGGRRERRDEALRLLAEALATAQELGMVDLTRQALAARLEAQGLSSLDTTTSIDFMIEAVASERPDIAAHAAPDGKLTILFSDIEDSTLTTERLGDERWLEVLRGHNAIFRRLVAEHGGTEVKNQGDGFMLVFPDSARALRCAAAIQLELAVTELAEGERLRVRMGLHAGEVISEEGDFFGRSVILAARIAAAAAGGEILVSDELRERAVRGGAEAGDGGAEVEFDAGSEIELKGLAGTHRVHRAEWRRGRPLESAPGTSASAAGAL